VQALLLGVACGLCVRRIVVSGCSRNAEEGEGEALYKTIHTVLITAGGLDPAR
jgi:hypothetical protein